MESYLLECRQHLSQLDRYSSIHFVIGNESCDLDSAVAANVIAFITHRQLSQNSCLVLPILNTSHEDLKLKSEVLFWFEEVVQINRRYLITKDDIDFKNISEKQVFITLVDHNENKEFCQIGQIVEIIDHHKPSLMIQKYSIDSAKVFIDTEVGSCCSLVAERFLSSSLASDTQLALLIYGAIILDTICFSKAAQRYNDRDINAVKRLESVLGIADTATRSEVYQQLIKAKNSIENFTTEQLIEKDIKVVETSNKLKIAISSISGTLISKLNLELKLESLEQLSSSNRYNAIVILGIENNIVEKIARDLAIFTTNRNLMHIISSFLESESELELKLLTESKSLRIYTQNNAKASRKVILPLILSVFNELKLKNDNQIQNESDYEKEFDNMKTSSNKTKVLTTQISTADVDPEFVINYKPETVEFLESPKYGSAEREVESDHSLPNTPFKESVYGSYIEDSFVGELVGDYISNSGDKDDCDLAHNWALNNSINNEIEFEFDSFGPESIIYSGNNEELEECVTPNISEQNNCVNNDNRNESDILNEHKPNFADLSNKENPNDHSSDTKESKLNALDSETSFNSELENNDQSYFKRNSSLTQSQRKKISPRLNFQQILNSSDDMSPVIVSDSQLNQHPLKEDNLEFNKINSDRYGQQLQNTPISLSINRSVDDDETSRGLTRRPSTTKKKIPVNRDFFTNEELIDKSEENVNQISELTAQTELEESRAWKLSCPIGPDGDVKPIDMKVIEPYKKVISHGGYFHSNASVDTCNFHSGASPAIIVFSTCYLPYRSRKDYDYVMDNLFMYVLTTLHNLVADDYILIYFHNAGSGNGGNNMPTFGWLKRCYYMIDRKLKKNLKGLYLVHPTFWLKTLIIMSKPFISSKFSKKLKFVNTLSELSDLIPIEHVAIPEPVKNYDEEFTSNLTKL